MTRVTSRKLILFIIYIYTSFGVKKLVVVEVIVLVWVFSHCVLKICFDISEECTAPNFRMSESV